MATPFHLGVMAAEYHLYKLVSAQLWLNECIEEGRTLRANSPAPAAPPEKHSLCGNISRYSLRICCISNGYRLEWKTFTQPCEVTMPKEVQMSIKMEPELRDQFMAVAVDRHRPAAQIIRELMRMYIAASETPNALTAETLRKSDKGEDVLYASNASDLFKQLGI